MIGASDGIKGVAEPKDGDNDIAYARGSSQCDLALLPPELQSNFLPSNSDGLMTVFTNGLQ
jgi:hypothetical protein